MMRSSRSSPLEKQFAPALRWAPTVLLALSICAGTFWLWGVPLQWFELKSDDFVYIARSRTAASLWSHLLAPHNGHVVPLFLVETHLLARLAGSLEAMPAVYGWATYATLVLSMALTGHLVAWETGRPAYGLAGMAAVGFTSVLGTAVLWYSAGQALAAGSMILAMLAALQAWRARGSWWLLVLAALAALAAPLFWTPGYTAGLVGAAYLWSDGRGVCRRAAAMPLVVSAMTFLIARDVAPRIFTTISFDSEMRVRMVLDAAPAVAHSAQAICEALIFNNLGLDTTTTEAQALVIGLVVAGLWVWTRRRPDANRPLSVPRVNPLEAAGAVLVASSFGMIYVVRGTESTFDGLRALGWYNAIPELGAVLFVAGWWSGRIESPPPKTIKPPPRIELLVFVLFAATMLVLQAPRADRVIFQYEGLSAKFGGGSYSRTPGDLAQQARAQRQALLELDRLERSARQRGLGRAGIRRDADRVMVPGMPVGFDGVGSTELLDVPDSTHDSGPLDPADHGNINKHG
jgi:hypothetical protein